MTGIKILKLQFSQNQPKQLKITIASFANHDDIVPQIRNLNELMFILDFSLSRKVRRCHSIFPIITMD